MKRNPTVNHPVFDIKTANELLADASHALEPDSLYTHSSGAGLSLRSPENELLFYRVKPVQDLPPYSVWTVDAGYTFNYVSADALSKRPIKEAYRIYLTNGNVTFGQNGDAWAHVIGTHRPHIVKYTGTDPVLGDQVGPDANAYTVTKKGEGLICVSDADTTNKLVWVKRYLTDTDVYLMELVSAQMLPCNSGAPTGVDAYLTKWDPGTCAYVNDTAKGLKKVFDPTCLNTLAMGDRFWARRKPQVCSGVLNERYEVIASVAESTVTQSGLLRFKLKNTLSLASTTTAIEVTTGSAYTETGPTFNIKDPWNNPGMWREDLPSHASGQGYKGWCVIPPYPELDGGGNPIREIVYMEHIAKFIEFTLVEDMGYTIPNQALVNNVTYYFGKDPADVFDGSTGREFYVHDRQQLFPLALLGAKGHARYDERTHKYIVTACDQMAILLKATISGAMCPNDDASISGLQKTSWVPYGKLPAPAPSTAKNYFKLAARSGSSVLISYNYTASEWFVIQVQHEEAYLGNNLVFNEYNCQIEHIRRKYSVQACDDSFITDTIYMTRAPVVVGAIKGECALAMYRASACFLGYQAEDTTLFPMAYVEYVDSVAIDGCSMTFSRNAACVWSVSNAADTTIVFETLEIVTDIKSVDIDSGYPEYGCKVEVVTKYACVLSSEDGFTKDAITFTRQRVVTDVYRDEDYGVSGNDCLVQDTKYISVPCVTSTPVTNSIICFTEC